MKERNFTQLKFYSDKLILNYRQLGFYLPVDSFDLYRPSWRIEITRTRREGSLNLTIKTYSVAGTCEWNFNGVNSNCLRFINSSKCVINYCFNSTLKITVEFKIIRTSPDRICLPLALEVSVLLRRIKKRVRVSLPSCYSWQREVNWKIFYFINYTTENLEIDLDNRDLQSVSETRC